MLQIADAEKHYQDIASEASRLAAHNFRRLWVRTEADDGVSATGLYFQGENGKHYFLASGLESLDAAMYRLREAQSAANAEAYAIAIFELSATGQFKLDYSYHSLEGSVGDWERAQEWERNVFGKPENLTVIE